MEVEQRLWCHAEELQTRMTIIHTLENRLTAMSEQHEEEMMRMTQKVLKLLTRMIQCTMTKTKSLNIQLF